MGLLNSIFGPAEPEPEPEPKPKQSNGRKRRKRISPTKVLAHQIAAKVIGEMSLSAFTDEQVIKLMDAGIELFEEEPARVSLQAPCFIFGDLHGQLPYFLKFFSDGHVEPQLLKLLPPHYHLLFLGDYVDRGDFSLEVVALLVSLKVLFPNKVTLLRGNHEIEDTNMGYTFYDEVEKKRPTGVDNIYQACNKLFMKLPLCAVISNTFLCMHGGLPRPEFWDILMGDSFEKPKTDEDLDDNNLFLDLLWADPTNNANKLRLRKQYEPDSDFQAKYGNYRFNRERDVSIQFNDRFAQSFFNRFPHIRGIFRAHESYKQGHAMNEARTICTIFSSPRYAEDGSGCGSVLKLSTDLKHAHFITLNPTPNEGTTSTSKSESDADSSTESSGSEEDDDDDSKLTEFDDALLAQRQTPILLPSQCPIS
uniref:Serine/threonine-protein phosphatase n=1 Tax=Globodera rostochiensis TaxID=31243 RepID=A0A914ICC7_GLORO